jgi:hypothetical protein
LRGSTGEREEGGHGREMGWETIPPDMLKDMVERMGVEMLFKTSELLFRGVRERFVKTPQPRKDDLSSAWTTQLDDLVHELAPAFQVGTDTALYNLVFKVHVQDEHWRGVHNSLNILTAWFKNWNTERMAVRQALTPDVLVNQIEGLYDMVLFTSWAGDEISKWVQAAKPDEYAYQNFKVASQRFDLFLTKFESFLRKLPAEFGLEEKFFPGGPLFKRMSL